MAVNVGSVEVLMELRDKLTAQLQNPSRSLVRLSSELRKLDAQLLRHEEQARKAARAHDSTSSAIDKFGKQVRTTLVHVAAAATAYKALAAASKSVTDVVELVRTFEKIENVTGVTRAEVDKLRTSLNTLSTATAKGPQELAEGFYAIASAGIDGAEATKILTASARASAVGLGDTKDIARSITAAINAYGKENLTAAKAADVLFATVREGGAEASEVAGVFGRVVGIASQLGVSFAEVGSFIATFTRLGVGADEAVTALRGSLTAMLTPTRNQEEALRAVGMSMDGLRQSVREKGLTAALIELTRASQGNEDIIGAVIPNVRSLAGVLGVAGKQADAYREVTDKVTNSTGDLGRAFDDVSKSASFQWDQLRAQFEQLSISLGRQLLPGVIAFRQALASFDEGELQQIGADAAAALTALAKIVEIVVGNLDALKAAIAAILVLKVGTWLGAFVAGLGAVPPAAAAATSSTAALGTSIARLAGPIGIAVAALYFLSSKAKQYVGDAQREIERIVEQSDRAGVALRRLQDVRAGGTVTLTEFEQLKTDAREAQTAIEQLARRRDQLAKDQADNARGLRNIHDKEIASLNDSIRTETARRDSLNATVETAFKYQRVTKDVAAAWEEVGEKIKLPNAGAVAFAQRQDEILSKLKDQLEASRADLELAKARRDEGEAGVRMARDMTVEARAQLEVTKVLNSLESSKHKLTAATRAEITKLVTEWVRVKDEVKRVNDEVRQQEADVRSQERALAQMYRIIEKRAEHERRVRSELQAQAEALQDQFIEAQLNLETSEAVLAALLSHGREAARAAEIEGDLRKQNVRNARELSVWLAQVEEQQARINYLIAKVGELAKPAWQVYLDAAFDAIDAIGDALSDVIVQAAMTGKVEWENVWESLKSSLIRIFADMLADMLKRWIATQLAMRAAAQSINAGGAASGSSSSNIMGGLLGGGSGGIPMFSTGGGAATGTSTASTASTLAGWAVAAYALYVVYKGFVEDRKRKFASISLGDVGEVTATAEYGRKYMSGLSKAVDALLESLRTWLDEFDVQMTKFANLTIEADKSGFSLYGAGGHIIGHFKTAEEAISAAQAFMIQFGEFAESVPQLIRSAIAASDMNMDDITSNVEFARTLLTQNMEQFALAIHDASELFVEQIRRSFELFGQVGRNFNAPALLEATGSAILHFTSSLTSLYNQLTGHKEDPKEAAERQRVAYNAQRAIMIAQLTLLYEEIKARIALYQAQLLTLQGLREGGYGGGVGPGGAGRGEPIPSGGPSFGVRGFPSKGGGAFTEDPRNPTNDPQLATLLQVLDALARALGNLPGEIAPGGVKPGGAGGRGRGQRQQVEDFIEQQRFALDQAGRSPLAREIEEIRRSFAEQLEAAGKNVKLRQQLLALEQESIAAARERFQLDVENRFKELTGQTNAFTELRKRFADMRRDILDAGYAADRMGEMMRELARAEADAVRLLSQQMAADLLGGLAQYIQDETVRAEFLKQAAIIKFHLDMANYKAQLKILEALGTLAPEVLEGIKKAIKWIEDNPPNFDVGGFQNAKPGEGDSNAPPSSPGHEGQRYGNWVYRGGRWMYSPYNAGGGGSAGAGGGATENPLERALELLRKYQSESLSSWHRALQELNRDFDLIRASLGNTPEVMQAYADALARLREEFLSGLRAFYEELSTGAVGGGGSVRTQFEAARAKYAQLLATVQGGDLSQADALEQAARQFIELAGAMFDTSTLGFQNIKQQILSQLAAVLGIQTNNVIGGPEWFTQGTQAQMAQLTTLNTNSVAQVAATANVASVVDIASRRQEVYLAAIEEKLQGVIDRMDANDGTTVISSTIAAG